MTQILQDYLRSIGACRDAQDWVGDRTPAQAWAECPRGDWLLWWLGKHDVNCSAAGYWCAERARQAALQAMPPSKEREALALCAPIVDWKTSSAARAAARAAAGTAETVETAAAWAETPGAPPALPTENAPERSDGLGPRGLSPIVEAELARDHGPDSFGGSDFEEPPSSLETDARIYAAGWSAGASEYGHDPTEEEVEETRADYLAARKGR